MRKHTMHGWMARVTGGLIALGVAGSFACDYNPPPEVKLRRSLEGSFKVGDVLRLEFSEPVDPESFVIQIWPNERDLEGEFTEGTEPSLTACRPADSPCDTTRLSLDENGLGASIELDPTGLGRADVPLVLEVMEGLADLDGRQTGVPLYFDFQFKPSIAPLPPDAEINFDEGVYIIGAQVEDPLPVIITIVTDIRRRVDGRVALAGGDADEIEGAAPNTQNPEELRIDTTDQAYGIFAYGQLGLQGEDTFLASEPFNIALRFGTIAVNIRNVRLEGIFVPDPATGFNNLEGTLSYTQIELDSGTGGFTYEEGSVSFTAPFSPPDVVPSGNPQVCGELCGVLAVQCDPPPNFPGEGYCD